MLRGERRWVARASLGHWAGPRPGADGVAECFDLGADWWSLAARVLRLISVVTAVAFTALCFAYLGRTMPTPLATPQTCARARRAARWVQREKRCTMRWGCALCGATRGAIGTHHDIRSAAPGFGLQTPW